MRVAVISDTHDVLREEVLEQIRLADAVIHAGDISKPEIVDRMKANLPEKSILYLVRGNADGDWAMRIPETMEFQLEQVHFFVVHNRKKAVIPEKCDIVISGHTHRFQAETADGRLWLNPGACGRRRFRSELSMAVLQIEGNSWQTEKIRIGAEDVPAEKSVYSDAAANSRNSGSASGDPMELSSGALLLLISGILKRMNRGKTISQIAGELNLEESFVEEICRISVTHPGVTANGILDKLEVNRHIGA
ncbi:MAG: metallophosphatase family protein [Lachnospiraceae bacterium]|nr:metallophosphatase family protein [Lachnospiraceae bacterium]